jgi:hypothetical protein
MEDNVLKFFSKYCMIMCTELNWPRIASNASVVLIGLLMAVLLTYVSDTAIKVISTQNLHVVTICWAHCFLYDEHR